MNNQPKVFGIPGSSLQGLRGPKFDKGFEGERRFHSLLQERGFLEDYDSFWSLEVGQGRHQRIEIDCVLASGDKVLLIDVKNWNFEKNDYSQPLPDVIIKKGRGAKELPEVYHLGNSLLRGQTYLSRVLPGTIVRSATVFLSTTRDQVSKLSWPGSTVTLSEDAFYQTLERNFPVKEPNPEVRNALIPFLNEPVVTETPGFAQGLLF